MFDVEMSVDLGNGLVLELRRDGAKLGSSFVPGEVSVRGGEVLVGGRPLAFTYAVKCPVKVGGVELCGEARRRPRFIYRAAFAPGLSDALRIAELHATNALNRGYCLARYLYSLVRGSATLWDIYYRKAPRLAGGVCGYVDRYFASRGLRELAAYDPSAFSDLDEWTRAVLGLLRFGDALRLVDRSWRGFAVAMRYGLYSALSWDLPLDGDSWMLLLGLYSALDPFAVPGGVALDVGILRALPYLVARLMGGFAVLFSSGGRPFTASNLNVMASGGRIRGAYASCDGDRCVVGDLYFNICVDADCAVVRTWDFEFRGRPVCSDLYTFVALRPCK
ncbi:MAG: hypothetical protein ACP5I3_08700 [Thermoproteus sp.]